jgi:hypothetical protein
MPEVEPVTNAVFPFSMIILNSRRRALAESAGFHDFCAKRRQFETLCAAAQYQNRGYRHVSAILGKPIQWSKSLVFRRSLAFQWPDDRNAASCFPLA